MLNQTMLFEDLLCRQILDRWSRNVGTDVGFMTRRGEEVKLDQNTEPGFSATQQHTTHSMHVGKSACSGPRLWFYNCIPCFITKNEEQVSHCRTYSQPYLKQNKSKPNLKSVWVWHISNFFIWGDWVLSAPFKECRHPRFQRLFFPYHTQVCYERNLWY